MTGPGQIEPAVENGVTDRLTVPAPAKLNLFLHVTGRRADGYHTLETLFVALDFGDTIIVTRRSDGRVICSLDNPEIPAEADLVLRAAQALRTATACTQGAEIRTIKRIPLGSGLGGGSSDAASVLLALNRLWDIGLSRSELSNIGLTLGADVPFFLSCEPALASGVGERLVPVSVPALWFAIVVPAMSVSTAAVFAAPELTRDAPSMKIEVFSEGYGRNDLQPVAVARFPAIAAALDALRERSNGARMTGSGSSVFAPFFSEDEARTAIDARPRATRGFVARTLARHPLASFA